TAASVPAASKVAKGSEAQPTSGAAAGASDDRALQAQLEGQVNTLQQTLAKMQETITAQDAQIADLNRKIAARVEQQRAVRATRALAARIAPEVESTADERAGAGASSSDVAASRDDTSAAQRPPKWWEKRATYYWAGTLGAAAILMGVLITVIRRRREAEELQ